MQRETRDKSRKIKDSYTIGLNSWIVLEKETL